MGKRALQGYAVLVYVFLYAPIAVVVLYAFNGGRQVLNWEGFSTKWFGEALADPTITEPFRNSLLIALGNAAVACALGTALALSLPRMRRWVRVPLDALVYMTLVTPEIVFGISALIFFVQLGNWLGLGSILGLWRFSPPTSSSTPRSSRSSSAPASSAWDSSWRKRRTTWAQGLCRPSAR